MIKLISLSMLILGLGIFSLYHSVSSQERLLAACICHEGGDLLAFFLSRPSFNQRAIDNYRSGYSIIISAPRCRIRKACKDYNRSIVEGTYIFRNMFYQSNYFGGDYGKVPFVIGSPNWSRY